MIQSARVRTAAAAQEALEDAEQRVLKERASLLESITDAFYALDREWPFTYDNARALDFYGRQRSELLGKVFWHVFPMARGSALEEPYERALREQCSAFF